MRAAASAGAAHATCAANVTNTVTDIIAARAIRSTILRLAIWRSWLSRRSCLPRYDAPRRADIPSADAADVLRRGARVFVVVAREPVELRAQQAAPARDARHHRADRDLEGFGDLPI